MNIYIGNLPRESSEDDLREAFEAFGQVAKVTILKDPFTGRPKGFGFVEMPSSAEAQSAIAGLNGTELMDRQLTVEEARPRREGRGGQDRRGGRRPR